MGDKIAVSSGQGPVAHEHFQSAFPLLGHSPGGGSSVAQSDIAAPCDCHIHYGGLS